MNHNPNNKDASTGPAADLHRAWMAARQASEEIQKVYNDYLTRIDQAIALPPLEESVPVLRELQRNMNDLFDLAVALKEPSAGPARKSIFSQKAADESIPPSTIRSVFQKQQDFNATIVHILNEIVEYLASSTRKLSDLLQLQILYFQQITPWMDGKIHELRSEQNHNVAFHIAELSKPSVDRYDLHRFRVELEEIKSRLAGVSGTKAVDIPPASQSSYPLADDYRYFVFEELFRGPSGPLIEKLKTYLPLFEPCPDPILDIGCGRGEFLKLMKDAGRTAYGIEINRYDVRHVQEQNLTVCNEDVITHLQKLDPESLGGVFSAQVIEHLAPETAHQMILRLHHVLKPGGRLVIETVNPLSFYAFHHMYLKDPTHVFPVHPETLAFFVKYAGFHDVRIESISPVPEKELVPGPGPEVQDAAIRDYLRSLAARINEILFPAMEYFVTGVRL